MSDARTTRISARTTRITVKGTLLQNLSASQRRVIDSPGVALIGMDMKGRPVVEAMTGNPQQLRRWSLTKTGDPFDVAEPIR